MLWVVGDNSELGTSSGDEGREEVGLEVSEGARLEEVGLKDSGGTFEDVGLRDSGVSQGRNKDEGIRRLALGESRYPPRWWNPP